MFDWILNTPLPLDGYYLRGLMCTYCCSRVIQRRSFKIAMSFKIVVLTLSWRRSLSYRSLSTDFPANQWNGFYKIGTSIMKELKSFYLWNLKLLGFFLLLLFFFVFDPKYIRFSCFRILSMVLEWNFMKWLSVT